VGLLIVTSVLSAAFGLLVRHSQVRKRNLAAVGAINYIAASLFHLVLSLLFGMTGLHAATIWVGVLGGLAYSITFRILLAFMHLRGLSITAVVMRLSVVVPLFFSLVVWGEQATTIQFVGALLTLLSLPFLALAPKALPDRVPTRSVLLLLALFLGVGLCALSIRGYHQTGIRGEESLFFATLFGTAAVVMTVTWLRSPEETVLADIPHGIAAGLANAVQNRLLIACLQILPAILVYPFFTTVGLIVTILICWFLWGERISRREMAGTLVAAFGIVLINLRMPG
jgi:drug/metabolite transporter (DMT)-like permease